MASPWQPDGPQPFDASCRVCGCTEDHACLIWIPTLGTPGQRACGWAAPGLCDNPACILAAEAERV